MCNTQDRQLLLVKSQLVLGTLQLLLVHAQLLQGAPAKAGAWALLAPCAGIPAGLLWCFKGCFKGWQLG
ncbi:hypothetical protein V8C86DRAFT_2740534, partial [Haematococcus lacustris]